ncbi:tandem-95 repeat protein, partial [Fulvivirga sp. RKSG066]|uniref:putative Ig domain-containing protein n=1 Tax=Fulvivirga aurantia TaxID=2529383 RepID=UPI0012BBEF7D
APSFTSSPVTSVNEDTAYSYNISTTDPDAGDVLEITALSKPGWLSLVDNGDGTGLLSGTPLNANVGNNEVVLKVEDGAGAFANQSFTVVVNNTNDVPVITSTPPTTAQQGLQYSYNMTTTDPDAGDVLTITAPTGLPSWLTLTDNGDGTALLAGTPGNPDLGTHNVSLRVTDASGAQDNENFQIVVDNTNDPPVFESSPITSVDEDDFYDYQIQTSDPDVGESLDIVIIDKPSWLSFTDNGDGTAVLSGTPVNENVGSYAIKLRVTDQAGQTTQQNFTLTVNNTNDAPQFVSSPVTTVLEDDSYTYNIVVGDEDTGDALSISINTIPSWLSFVDNSDGTATLSGMPLNEDVGVISISLQAQDVAGATVNQDFNLTVVNTNDAPEITSTPVTTGQQDDLYTYPITTSDVDAGDIPVISADNLPQWLSITNNGDGTAELTGTPGNADVGIANITLIATDGGNATATQSFQITIANINDAPVFESQPVVKVAIGDAYTYEIVTSDPDAGDDVSLSVPTLPGYLNFTDYGNGNGRLSGVISVNAPQNKNVSIVATDMNGASTNQDFTFIINNPPVVTSFEISTNEDVGYDFATEDFANNFIDDQGDVLESILIESLPLNGTLNFNDQEVTVGQEIIATNLNELVYLPALNFFGEDSFTWQGFDGLSSSENTATVSVEIISVNDAPRIITSRQNDVLAPLEYSLGDPEINIVEEGELSIRDDDDDDLITGAIISIAENFTSGDLLNIEQSTDSELIVTYDQSQGILTVEGEGSEAKYTGVLEKIKFSSPVSGSATLSDKQIEIIVMDALESSNVVSRAINITEVFPELDLVNAFTPNNDGVNDIWDIGNLQFYSDIDISIFDQNGTLIYNCQTQNCSWDGKVGGKVLAVGPYFYTIDLNNGKRTYKGTVTILK